MKNSIICLISVLLMTSCISDKKYIVNRITDLNAFFLLKDFKNFDDVNSRNSKGNTLLHEAVFADKVELSKEKKLNLIKLLIEKGADINSRNSKGETPLHIVATQDKQIEVAKFLLKYKADVNIKNNKGETPLDYCGYNLFFYYNDKLVELLIKNSADPNSYNSHGSTLLHVLCGYYAGDYGTEDDVENLINLGADINSREKKTGNTPLMKAVQRNGYAQTKVILVLLKNGAGINLQNKDGNSAIHFIQHQSSIDLLVKAGADTNHQNKEGNTILHFFSECDDKNNKHPVYLKPKPSLYRGSLNVNRVEIIKSLIKHGALLDIKNKRGETSKGLLKKECNKELMQLLEVRCH